MSNEHRPSVAADVSPTVTTVATTYSTGTDDWVTSWIPCYGLKALALLLDITKDDATTLELKAEAEDKDGTDGYTEFQIGATGAAALDEVNITAADLAATDRVKIEWDVDLATRVRFRFKKTGGSGTVTVALSWVGS